MLRRSSRWTSKVVQLAACCWKVSSTSAQEGCLSKGFKKTASRGFSGFILNRSFYGSAQSSGLLPCMRGPYQSSSLLWSQHCSVLDFGYRQKRFMVKYSKLKPKFQGRKLKLSSSYKLRFRKKADGTIKMHPPGVRHRRVRKSKSQLRRLKQPHAMHKTYANILKRMGFK